MLEGQRHHANVKPSSRAVTMMQEQQDKKNLGVLKQHHSSHKVKVLISLVVLLF